MQQSKSKQTRYRGAVVFEPQRGFYGDPLFEPDFSCLYPSIARTLNLPYSSNFSGIVYLWHQSEQVFLHDDPTFPWLPAFTEMEHHIGIVCCPLDATPWPAFDEFYDPPLNNIRTRRQPRAVALLPLLR